MWTKGPRSEHGWKALQQQLDADLRSLPDAVAKRLLIQYATALPSLAQAIMDKSHELRQDEAETSRDYEHYYRRTYYLINDKYLRLESSEQAIVAGDVGVEIEKMLKTMKAEIQPHSSFDSKYSALETMLQIFEVLLESTDGLAADVREDNNGWDGLFLQVLSCLTCDELQRLASHQYSTSEYDKWFNRLTSFIQMAIGRGFVDRIEEAYDILEHELPLDFEDGL
ncbi:hypothetical protein PG996_013551 [Apiospora saccharicola]|uniref:NWD NACHT-NTPase N-terminal domain-containing protein n=1 Tax=Apiospora saccharicola TaxID=335842 RepID=A0ABR1U5T7_9PEZI